jgi:hypothetical protein
MGIFTSHAQPWDHLVPDTQKLTGGPHGVS